MPLMTWFLWESDDLPQLHIIFLTSCSCSDQLEDGLVVGLFCIQYIRRLALLFEHHLIPRKHGKWEKSCTSSSFLCFLGQARGSAMHASCSVVGCNYVRPHPLITYVHIRVPNHLSRTPLLLTSYTCTCANPMRTAPKRCGGVAQTAAFHWSPK